MIELINEEELEMMETLHNPVAFTECVFSDLVSNLPLFEEDSYSEVRLGQYVLLSFEYLVDDLPGLSQKENFKLKEGAGTIYCFGGRKFGKSLLVEIVDICMSLVLNAGDEVGFASYDQIHIRGILEKVIQVLKNHPFFRIFNTQINRSPNFRFYAKNGYTLDSVNMNLSGESPGAQFYQKHFKRLYVEEASFETDEVYEKRLDSISELGCVFRIAGMTDFTKYTPAGRTYYDEANRSRLVNLPQYVNPMWGEAEKEKAIREHGGEKSISYRVYVKGEITEDGIAAFDMERVKKNYDRSRTIKNFEVNKENFNLFDNVIVVERPKNANKIYVAADIGESAATEIIIVSELEGKYKYLYNITLFSLTDKQQFEVIDWIAKEVSANFIGLDCSEGCGRAIFRALSEVYQKENLIWVAFQEKIPIELEKDELGNEKFVNGKPVYKEEYVEGWSIKRLRDIFYEEGKITVPLDYKLDRQFNSIRIVKSGARTTYPGPVDDHLFAAWKVWAISEWQTEFVNNKPIQKKVFAKSGI